MKNSQLAHVWAQQTKESGKGSNMFFEGRSIYSYGKHYLIATFKTNHKGESCVLINSESYSHSTGQHTSYVSQAVSNKLIFRLPISLEDTEHESISVKRKDELWLHYSIKATQLRDKIKGCKTLNTLESTYTAYTHLCEQANAFSSFFSYPNRLQVFKSIEAIYENKKASFIAQIALKETPEYKAKQEQAKAKRLAREAQLMKEDISRWFKHESLLYYTPRDFPNIYLRLTGIALYGDKPTHIETSQGASFPISDAIEAFKIIKAHKKLVDTKDLLETVFYDTAKPELGDFTIDSIDNNGNVKAGCHFVKYEEIERMAKLLNLI